MNNAMKKAAEKWQKIYMNFGRSGLTVAEFRAIGAVLTELQANGYVQTFIKAASDFCKGCGFLVEERNGQYIIRG